ncbi:sigma-54-dependent Fis family transcriptional regulator [Enterovibrio norvegicus FF-33]|uniref:Sigma-54-dependent Fis family transcriptional regulator n=1 Tax=Enterovibrio norvegicus FF-454 TaxID=1185651 RepID=A0A1E5C895_9GAMM|nr:sigma 54-interacting transcriptional regulator [Enterovibrio norvegicus]OEE61754.1 sigma-54-dependent Fis family transcriptional regulator [Enterovibrio norvegicus FF-454]OEE66551.1 sigma-54-dependent Fis family transcriptional regulator [Enterovibrio norvegicus FF-33]OEE75443.1 sigma-54-dependent Fis family transcriptional regulator [Enterovibrio norvegicus FF-162]
MVDTHQSLASQLQEALLIVEDDPYAQKKLCQALESEGSILTAHSLSVSAALQQLLTSVVVIGRCDANTLSLMKEILSFAPRTKVLVVVNTENDGDAVLALESGAFDIIEQPFSDELLRLLVRRARHIGQLEREVDRLKSYERRQESILGGSPQMMQLLRMVDRVSLTDINVLIYGESGTGKALLARAIHDRSPRSEKPFITINCASIPEELLENELFGIESDTLGVRRVKVGKIEAAHGGTLFLDEIGDMPLHVQAKVLRFVQDRVVDRISGQRSIPVDVKIVCATHQDLKQRCSEKRFREDLLHRIGDVPITIPPLRERGDDVLLLAKTFLLQFNQSMNRSISGFSDDALEALLTHMWPGNVRELQNKVKSAVIMADGNQISASDLALTKEQKKDSGLPLNIRQVREEAERQAVTRALARAEGNMSQTANLLGVSRPTLYTLIEKYALQR